MLSPEEMRRKVVIRLDEAKKKINEAHNKIENEFADSSDRFYESLDRFNDELRIRQLELDNKKEELRQKFENYHEEKIASKAEQNARDAWAYSDICILSALEAIEEADNATREAYEAQSYADRLHKMASGE